MTRLTILALSIKLDHDGRHPVHAIGLCLLTAASVSEHIRPSCAVAGLQHHFTFVYDTLLCASIQDFATILGTIARLLFPAS